MMEVSRSCWSSNALQRFSFWSLIFSLLFLLPAPALGQLSPTLWTSYVPFTVRSPYFSAWMNTTNVSLGNKRAPELWPSFWPRSDPILGWAGHLRVDAKTTYKWIGDAGSPGGLNSTVLKNIQITPTRTIMNITAGPIDLTVTYLSPIEPSDPVMQSLPFAYFYVTAVSNDGQSHDVQIYSDISAEWLSGDRGLSGNWVTEPTDTILYHKQFLVTPQAFTEMGNQAQDATVYLAALLDTKLTYQTDTDAHCRGSFSINGVLPNSVARGPLPINNPFTVFAISKDLGTVADTPTNPAVWAIGMLRDPVVQFSTSSGAIEQRNAYWRTEFPTDVDIVTTFLQDYPNAVQRAETLDAALERNASTISSHYADLVALTARQTMGTTELTVGVASDGSFNLSDVKMFMKDLGGPGPTGQRVNPVEVMYSSFPFFLSLNASYGGWLLSPVLEFASSNAWGNPYAPRDIGVAYPNATGNSASHSQGVEQSGNMLIMALAYARASGDGQLLNQHYPLLKRWADYLVNNTSPVPSGQTSADGDSTVNSTNLAIKGIIAIKAMAQISAALHQNSDADHYSNLATAYANTWKSLALPSGAQQILSSYGALESTFALPYNLFADKWLGTGLIDDATYNAETSGLQSLLNLNPNGLPITSDPSSDGNTAWTLFTAMTVTDGNVRNSMIDQVWNFASKNNSQTIFPTSFTLDGKGSAVNNLASAGVGGVYAPLALALPNVTITAEGLSGPNGSSGGSNGGTASKSNVGPIVGGVVGGVGGAVLLALLGFFLWRRSRRGAQYDGEKADIYSERPITEPVPYNYVREDQLPLSVAVSDSLPRSSTAVDSSRPSKMREAVGAQYSTPSSQAATTSYTPSRAPASSREPPTATSSSDLNSARSPISPSEVAGLRAEVENLRREMLLIHGSEPPPTYHEND